MAIVTAVETRPGTDPDRASFTTAMETARDQLTAARGICPDGPADLPGAIGRAVLATLLPARRLRYSARKVKCATSRYLNRDDGRPSTPTTITAIDIAVCTPPIDMTARPRRDRSTPRPPQPPTRRDRVTAIINTDPRRAWSGSELAGQLHPGQAPEPPHAARRMDSPRVFHPGRHRDLRTQHAAIDPGQPRQPLNYAALLRGGLRPALTPETSAAPQAGNTGRPQPAPPPGAARPVTTRTSERQENEVNWRSIIRRGSKITRIRSDRVKRESPRSLHTVFTPAASRLDYRERLS